MLHRTIPLPPKGQWYCSWLFAVGVALGFFVWVYVGFLVFACWLWCCLDVYLLPINGTCSISVRISLDIYLFSINGANCIVIEDGKGYEYC